MSVHAQKGRTQGYTGYSSCKHQLHEKYSKHGWFHEALGYLSIRYHPIERRILDSLRYVELAPENGTTFSYEFGSIIRDIGSSFGSVLDKIVGNTFAKSSKTYDIRDYRKFLVEEVDDIDSIATRLATPFVRNLVLPFGEIKECKSRLRWWDAYNNLKHSEIDNLQDACLSNVVYGMASLAILYDLMDRYRRAEGRLFPQIGYFRPLDSLGPLIFPQLSE